MEIKRLKETSGILNYEVSDRDMRMGVNEHTVKARAYAELGRHLHEACRGCEYLRHYEEPNVLRDSLIVSVACANKAPRCPDESPWEWAKTDLLGIDMPIRDIPFNPDELHHLMESVTLPTGGIVSDMITTASTSTAAGMTLTRDHIMDTMSHAARHGGMIGKDDTSTAVGVLGLIQRGWTLQRQAGDMREFVGVDGIRARTPTGPNRFVLTKSGMMDREVSEAVAREALDFMEKAKTTKQSEEELEKERQVKAEAARQAKLKAEEERRLQAQLKEVEQEAVKEQLEDLGFGTW